MPEKNVAATFVSVQTRNEIRDTTLNFKEQLDVRGMRGDEAIQAVTYFIDDALVARASRVKILHGTGTGALKTVIRQYLNTMPPVAQSHGKLQYRSMVPTMKIIGKSTNSTPKLTVLLKALSFSFPLIIRVVSHTGRLITAEAAK